MQISGMIYKRPEDDLWEVIKGQKTIRTSKLQPLIEPLLEKVQWQEEALSRNVKSIRRLNDKANRAKQKVKWKNDVIDRSSERIRAFQSQAQQAENQLERAKREIAGLKLDLRIAEQSGK